MYTYKAVITRIVDGDTIIVDIDAGFSLCIKDLRVRLLNYNAPESRGVEKEFGKVAKKYLEYILPLNKEIIVKTHKEDSFGRYLAEIYVDNLLINSELVSKGYGYAWDGKGERPTFDLTKPYPLIK